MADLGKAYIQIEPTAKGITKQIENELGDAGQSGGASFSKGFASVLGKGGKAVAGIAVAGASAVAGLTSAFVNGASNVAEYGDNIDKMSQKMGLSAESYQEWDAVMRHSGTSMETMKASMKTLAGAVETGKDAFDALGLSQEQLANMSQEQIFEATIAGLQNVEDTTQRTYLAGQLLGRGATELGALLNTSAEETQAMRDRVRELGGVMSGDAVKASAQFQDQLQDMQTAFQGISRNMLSEFLPSITQVMGGLTEIFSGNDGGIGMITEGVDNLVSGITKALPKVAEVGTKIVESIGQAIITNLPSIMDTGMTVILELGNALIANLPMIVDVGLQILENVITGISNALPTLIPAIVNVISTIVQTLIQNIPMLVQGAIQLFNGLVLGLVQAIPLIIEQLPTIIQAIVDAFITSLPLLIDGTIQLVMGLVQALPQIIQALIDAMPMIIEAVVQGLITALPLLVEGNIQLITMLIEQLPTIIAGLIEAIPQIISTIVQTIVAQAPMFLTAVQSIGTSIMTFVQTIGTQFVTQVGQIGNNILTNVKTWLAQLPTQTAYFVGQMIGKFVQLLATLPSKIEQIWNQIMTNLKAFAQRFITEGVNTVREFASKFIEGLRELPSRVMEIGGDIVEGLKNGISGAWDSLTSWVSDMASSLVQGFKDSFKIGSPSKIMRDEIGVWIPAGIAEGIKEGMGVLDDAVNGIATTMTPTLMASVSPYAPAPTSENPLYTLLATYLPIIASGENVNVSLDVSNDRLFRIIQTEQRRNTQLVGVNA